MVSPRVIYHLISNWYLLFPRCFHFIPRWHMHHLIPRWYHLISGWYHFLIWNSKTAPHGSGHYFLNAWKMTLKKTWHILDNNNKCVIVDSVKVVKRQWRSPGINHHLKLTCRHINCRHFCFNIKSISVHPLLWMNVMLDFICMLFAGMRTTFR